MTDIQRHAILLSLKKSFSGKWFDICGVSDACEVAAVSRYRSHANWATLSAMHCKTWEDIAEHRGALVMLVAELFGYENPLMLTEGSL